MENVHVCRRASARRLPEERLHVHVSRLNRSSPQVKTGKTQVKTDTSKSLTLSFQIYCHANNNLFVVFVKEIWSFLVGFGFGLTKFWSLSKLQAQD